MSTGVSFYAASILIYFGTWLIATWGYDVQAGLTKTVNLGFIATIAAGSYVTAVLTVGPHMPGETYLFGATLPFPIGLLAGVLAGGCLSLAMGLVVVPRLREEYLAIVTLVISVGLWTFVVEVSTVFNGAAGIAGVPEPIGNTIVPTTGQYWAFVGIVAVACVLCAFVRSRLDRPVTARLLGGIRDSLGTAEAIGVPTNRLRIYVMCLGGCFGGLSGGLLVEGIGAWNTSSWQIFEILVVLAAAAVGGAGSWRGIVVGVATIPILIGQGVTFLPLIGNNAVLSDNLQFVVVGIIEIAVLMLRPQGLFPGKLRAYERGGLRGGAGRLASRGREGTG